MEALAKIVDRLPRCELAHLPTPLERLPRLGEALGGVDLWVKRDDATGLGMGGNKVRKLEYLVAEAQARGATRLITTGGVQSNHARQTAAAAARCGLACELVLPRVVPSTDPAYERSGNLLLDRLFGARVFLEDDPEAAVRRIGERLEAAGGEAVFIPSGGSDATGCTGYVRAALELRGQAADRGVEFERAVVAMGSGGTAAGLWIGLAGEPQLDAMAVYSPAAETRAILETLASKTCEKLGVARPRAEHLSVSDDCLGEGYGIPSDGMREAVRLGARLEGLLLDPVYTGKAMAGLIAMCRDGRVRPGERVLFWHTGGSPGLFAYGEALDLYRDTPDR